MKYTFFFPFFFSFLALLVANWNLSISDTTETNITIHWPNLSPFLHQQVLRYFGLLKDTNGCILTSNIVTGNATSVTFNGLSPYREYRLRAVGVNGNGEAFKSAEVIAWTEEGGMY